MKAEFEAAVARSRTLSKTPSNDVLLAMYGLYKQATSGDVSGAAPSAFDIKGRAKYKAWEARKGMTSEDAMQKYIELIDSLQK